MTEMLRVSAHPSGWSVCRAPAGRRRRPVMAWAVFVEDGDCPTVAGLVARGERLVRGDQLAGFEGYAPGAGCEPQLEAPALPPADLDDAMNRALAVDVDSWDEYESRIRSALTAAADSEWAAACLTGFVADPLRWFRLWLQGRREHEATEIALWHRIRALARKAPGLSLEETLRASGISLGAMLAAPDPEHSSARPGAGRGEDAHA